MLELKVTNPRLLRDCSGTEGGARIFSASFIPFQSEIGLTQELRRVVGKEGG